MQIAQELIQELDPILILEEELYGRLDAELQTEIYPTVHLLDLLVQEWLCLEQMGQLILEHIQGGYKMDIDIEYKEYLISSRIKSLNGRINSIGTEEDSGESLEDLQAKIQVLTNILEML